MIEKRLLFRYSPYWGRCETPYFQLFGGFWRLILTSEVVKRKKKEMPRQSAIATHPLSTMRIYRSLGIFVIIFTQFSLVSRSILNRCLRNFAGTISWYHVNCPVNMTKFDKVLQKLLMRLMWNLLEYFQKLFILTSIQTSILYRLSCNFAGTIGRYYGNFPVNLAKFDWVLQKLSMRLVWNLIEYF